MTSEDFKRILLEMAEESEAASARLLQSADNAQGTGWPELAREFRDRANKVGIQAAAARAGAEAIRFT